MGFKPKPREEEVEEVAQEEVEEVAREEVVDLASTNQELEETVLDLGNEALPQPLILYNTRPLRFKDSLHRPQLRPLVHRVKHRIYQYVAAMLRKALEGQAAEAPNECPQASP